MFLLPAHSPDLNPVEWVWAHVKRSLANLAVVALDRLEALVRSGFYYWRRTVADRVARQAADVALAARIRAVHRESDGTYGVPRYRAAA